MNFIILMLILLQVGMTTTTSMECKQDMSDCDIDTNISLNFTHVPNIIFQKDIYCGIRRITDLNSYEFQIEMIMCDEL